MDLVDLVDLALVGDLGEDLGLVVALGLTVDLVEAVLGLVVDLGLATALVFAGDDFGLVAALPLDEEVAFLGRRGDKPSIDLFFSIVYNYSICGLN